MPSASILLRWSERAPRGGDARRWLAGAGAARPASSDAGKRDGIGGGDGISGAAGRGDSDGGDDGEGRGDSDGGDDGEGSDDSDGGGDSDDSDGGDDSEGSDDSDGGDDSDDSDVPAPTPRRSR
jgi:hypothetical protein